MWHRCRAVAMRGSYGQDAPPSSVKRLAPRLAVADEKDDCSWLESYFTGRTL